MKTISKLLGKNGNKKLKVLVSVLAAIIVFTTTYSLILPAITIDNETAQEEPGIEIMAEETEAAEEVTEAAIEEAVAEVVEAVEEAEPVIEEPAVVEEPAAEEASIIEETAETAADQTEAAKVSETAAAESQAATETTTAKAEETTTAAAVKMPKVTFNEETNKNFADKNLPNIIVKVEAEEGTFPEGTTMKVKYVTDDKKVEAAVKDAVDKDSRVEGAVKTIHTVDITFINKEGKEIEPLKEIKVTFKSDTIKDIDKPVLVHIPDEGKGEAKVVDQLSEAEAAKEGKTENEIIFKADEFSKYSITELVTGGVISADGVSYKVTVSYDEEAMIPSDAYLVISEIEDASDEYESYLSEAEAALLEGSDAEISFARFFNITIMSGDEVVEPQAPVDVAIEYAEAQAITEDTQINAIEFTDDTPNTLEVNVNGTDDQMAGVSFETEKLSEYGIVGTSLTDEITLPGSDDTYEVTVTYGADAKIPEGVHLDVNALATDSSEYTEAKEAVVADKKEKDSDFTENRLGFAALDISIVDENGNKIEPAKEAEVKVSIKLKSLPEGFNDETIEIQHLNERTAQIETVAEAQDVTVAGKTAEAQFTVTSFSTFALTWDDGTSYIHWGIMEDGTFTEWDKTNLDTSAGSISLNALYDGYTILSATYYTASESISDPDAGTDIEWNIEKNTDGTWKYTVRSSETTGTIADESQIYVYYIDNNDIPETEKPTVVPSTANDPLNTTKTVTANLGEDGEPNGTYKITLNVTGTVNQESHTVTSSANVILVLDVSTSMDETLSGGQTRLAAVKNAAYALVNAMPTAANVDMSVVAFGGSVFNTVNWTTINSDAVKTTINNAIRNRGTNQGTNWPGALAEAINQANIKKNAGDTDPTYVIFLTDGCPTTNTNGHNHGSSGTQLITDTCISNALDNMTTLVNSGYTVYGVYANTTSDSTRPYSGSGYSRQYTGDTDPLQYVMRVSGAGVANYYQASEADEIADVFEALAQTITNNLGYSNVSVDDGITALTSVEASVSVSGAAGNFEYKKSGGQYGSGVTWTDAPAASASGTGVTWDLSSIGNLENGVTYTVSFDIWPSQEAYDLIADLNNGLVDYDSLDPNIQAQIGGHDSGNYYLLTNTFLHTNYSYNGSDYMYDADKGDGAMPLETETITVKKIWNNPVDSHIGDDDESDPSVQLYLTKDGENYLFGEHAITVAPEHEGDREWVVTSGDIYISLGLIVHNEDGTYTIEESGHDYSIAEPDSFAYFWDLKADVYHPMVIDGKPYVLIQDDSASGTDGTDYYTIKGKKYVVSDATENVMTAVNDRRSNLNLTKAINDQSDDQGADRDTLFEYTITIIDSNATNGKAGDIHSDYYVWFSVYDPDHEYRTGNDAHLVDDATLETSSNVTAEAGNTGYFYVPSGENFTVKIKEGWNLRALNLPIDTTYSIVETVTNGWEFEGAEGTAWNYETNPGSSEAYSPAVDTGSATISGNIPNSNRSYTVTATNKWEPDKTLTVNKTWTQNNFVTAHGDINVALFKVEDGTETYIEGSVRTIEAPETAVTYHVSSLGENVVVREVTVSTETTGEGDDEVTTTTVTPIAANGLIAVEGETTTLDTAGGATDTYIVTYNPGTATTTSRTDTITNTMPKLSVNKTDMSGEALGGAKFTLTDEDGNVIDDSLESTEEGVLITDMYLSNGVYYLTETEAPAGYNKLSYKVKVIVSTKTDGVVAASQDGSVQTPYDVTLSNDKLSYSFAIANSDGTVLPNTGGSGTLPYTLGGIALIMASALMYGFRMRRRERRLN